MLMDGLKGWTTRPMFVASALPFGVLIAMLWVSSSHRNYTDGFEAQVAARLSYWRGMLYPLKARGVPKREVHALLKQVGVLYLAGSSRIPASDGTSRIHFQDPKTLTYMSPIAVPDTEVGIYVLLTFDGNSRLAAVSVKQSKFGL